MAALDGPASSAGMDAAEVVAIVGWLEGRRVVYQVNGGWAVDALVGRQTRTHGDLDLFIDVEIVPALHAWLQNRGYSIAEDWTPVRVEWRRGARRVDVHPMKIDAAGDGVQQGLGNHSFLHRATDRVFGLIGGQSVVVARAERLRELRGGYEPRPVDVHDLEILDILLASGLP